LVQSPTPYSSYTVNKGRFMYEYNIYSDNVLEIIYHNRRTHYKKIYRIRFSDNIDLKIIDEALKLADKMFRVAEAGVVKPNIPVYALIYVLNKRIPGFSYKCKIKKKDCPITVYKIEEGRVLDVKMSSLMEQMYRFFKKFRDKLF
jgi:hypothetical protein